VRRTLEARERRQMAPCAGCQTLNHLSGVRCSNCREPLPQPHPVGVLGVARLGRVANKRCPSCATGWVEKRLGQCCAQCGTAVFADSTALDAYLSSLEARLPKTLAICLGFSSISLFGLIPGILYYRVSLISSLRYYVPGALVFGVRWLVRMLNLVLLLLQVVPFVGAITLPLMCWLNFSVFSAASRRQAGTLAAPAAG